MNLPIQGVAGAAALVIAIIYGISGITSIVPGEVGLLVKQFGDNRGMQENTLDTGMHWVEPFMYDAVTYDTRLRQETLEDVPSNTADGQPITVDASFDVGLLASGVPGLHENVGKDYYDQVVYPAVRSALRNVTSRHASVDVYTGTGRAAIQSSLSTELSDRFEPMGIRISANLREIDFINKDFVQVLEQKASAEQQEAIQSRLAAAAKQAAIKTQNQAEGQKFKSMQEAEAQKYALQQQGEGKRLQMEEQAKGILAVGQAEADVIKLKAKALTASGGDLYRDIQVLGGLGQNVDYYGTPTGAPGTSTYIVDQALRGKIAVGSGGK